MINRLQELVLNTMKEELKTQQTAVAILASRKLWLLTPTAILFNIKNLIFCVVVQLTSQHCPRRDIRTIFLNQRQQNAEEYFIKTKNVRY